MTMINSSLKGLGLCHNPNFGFPPAAILSRISEDDEKPYSALTTFAQEKRSFILHIIHQSPSNTKHFDKTFVQRRPNVFDVGPISYKCFVFAGRWSY